MDNRNDHSNGIIEVMVVVLDIIQEVWENIVRTKIEMDGHLKIDLAKIDMEVKI